MDDSNPSYSLRCFSELTRCLLEILLLIFVESKIVAIRLREIEIPELVPQSALLNEKKAQ